MQQTCDDVEQYLRQSGPDNHSSNGRFTAPINNRLNVVMRSPTTFGLGRNGCWSSRRSQLPRALSFIFSLCCPLNECRKAAHSFFKIGRLFSLFLFSCSSLAGLRLSLADLAGIVFSLLLFYQATMGPGTLVSPKERRGRLAGQTGSATCALRNSL